MEKKTNKRLIYGAQERGWPEKERMKSVAEMAHAGGTEDDAVLVAAVDGVLVANTATGVGDDLNTRLAGFLHRIAPGEGEEGVAGHGGALGSVACLFQGDLHTLHTVGLPRTHA